jgi:endonuclease/exonuclease/phosphatase (EEP) superfamily protein YafD
MKIVVQNLQKRANLGGDLIVQYDPDVLLAQEINIRTEEESQFGLANYLSKMGFGTAIYGKNSQVTHVRHVKSPHAEIGGFVYKKTTVATCCCQNEGQTMFKIECVSFHGYNGQPRKVSSYLVDHVRAVLDVLDPVGPAVFAGDFNTWTQQYLDAVSSELQQAGFRLAHSWKYPGKSMSLDHVFVRELNIQNFSVFSNASDHDGTVFEIVSLTDEDPHKEELAGRYKVG